MTVATRSAKAFALLVVLASALLIVVASARVLAQDGDLPRLLARVG